VDEEKRKRKEADDKDRERRREEARAPLADLVNERFTTGVREQGQEDRMVVALQKTNEELRKVSKGLEKDNIAAAIRDALLRSKDLLVIKGIASNIHA
jgi:hypothetical protein